MLSQWRSPGVWKLLLWALLWLKTAPSFNSPAFVSFSYDKLNIVNQRLSKNEEKYVIPGGILPLTNVWVVMSNALIVVIVFQNVEPHTSFTVLQTTHQLPKHCKSSFVRHSSPVITVFKNAFRAPNTGKSLMNIAVSAPSRRKHLELLDLLPWVNTFSLNAHTHVNND